MHKNTRSHHTHLNTHTSARRLLLRVYHMRGFNSSHFVPPPPPFPPPQEEEEEEEKPQVVLRSVCPNCQHATTKTISTTTQRRRQRRREEEEDDEDDEDDGDNNGGCPLQLCEKCKYIFLTKGHEENADPEAPIKSLLLSEGEKEEECKGKKYTRIGCCFSRAGTARRCYLYLNSSPETAWWRRVNWSCAGRAKS